MKSSCCHSREFYVENNRSICLNSNCENYLGSTPFMGISRFWNNLFALFFFIFIFLFTFSDYSYNNDPITDSAEALLKIQQNEPLTEANLKLKLKNLEVVCQDEVYAQFLIESAHMTSYLFRKTNNLSGMRYPFKRNTSAIGIFLPKSDTIVIGTQKDLRKYSQQSNYAVYACWQDCLKDYKLWQDEYFKLKERYLAFLGANYAEDTNYVKKINQLKR